MGVQVLSATSPMESVMTMAPPQWRPDEWSDSCHCCGREFSLWARRRHHCRACGELVCGECSPFLDILPDLGYKQAVRVCKECKPQLNHAAVTCHYESSSSTASSGSPASSVWDSQDELDDNLVADAVDVLAFHSSDKNSKLMYDYFVQSEAINWLVDAEVVKTRRAGAGLFAHLLEEGYVSKKMGSFTSLRSAFYVLNDLVSSECRLSYYDNAMHSETKKCCNCSRSYLESMTSTPGFCSIDCKTNAYIRHADSARARRYL